MTPTITGHTTATANGASSPFTLNPATNQVGSAVATGDWIILQLSSSGDFATTKQPTAPTGWTNIWPFQDTSPGFTTFGVWAHKRAAGESTYSWTQSTSETSSTYSRMIFVSGAADVSMWVIGNLVKRTVNATSTTTVAESVTTGNVDVLAVALSGERTIAGETDGQVTCNNFTKQWFENDQDHTLFVATKNMAMPGATGDVTTTYPNAQTNNGIAGQIAIPTPVMPLMWMHGINSP